MYVWGLNFNPKTQNPKLFKLRDFHKTNINSLKKVDSSSSFGGDVRVDENVDPEDDDVPGQDEGVDDEWE
jgi:hypothetical protein